MAVTAAGRSPMEAGLLWWARAAAVTVLVTVAANGVGWATGIDRLTRVFASWPQMTPWTALLLAGLALAVFAQSGRPSRNRVAAGRGLAVVVGVLAVIFLAEYVTGRSFGLDQLLFPDAVGTMQSWPGRPSPQTAVSVLLLSVAVGLTRIDRRWTAAAWVVSLLAATALPFVIFSGHAYQALSLTGVNQATGMGISTAIAIVLLVTATFAVRPDRNPLAWLLARPDRWTLFRMVGILTGLPLLIGLSRPVFLGLGLPDDAAWVMSISVSTIVVGAATFYLSQREQRLLIEKEQISRERAKSEAERAEAEARFRLLADNAVDVIVHHRGVRVLWISPSAEAAFGWPLEQWLTSDLTDRVYPDDLGAMAAALAEVAEGRAAFLRCRVTTAKGGYHWVDFRGKPYIDAEGIADGGIAAMRIVDDQVEAERRLDRMARFDTLTGLVNRAEALARLGSILNGTRAPGAELGVLFCDVDRFKTINDTLGHSVGDTVLWTVAERISECVRHGDTVGRTGGDEMLVLLPGLHSLEEAIQIAEKIQARVAAPINLVGNTFHATLSIGATLALPGDSVVDVTARADAAMYQSKHAGGNTVRAV